MEKYQDREFYRLIDPILNIESFKKLGEIKHHGITRFEHSLRVSYFTYKITKKLHLNYKEATVAALVHDFFSDEVEKENSLFKLRRHPMHAVKNTKKYLELTDLQEDIIKSHMFPVTFTPPKYLESWIVVLADDGASIYERSYTTKKELSAAFTFLSLLLINYIKINLH